MRICIFGGPGIGKSVLASDLFCYLKKQNINVELVTEYVKTWAWEKREIDGYDQVYIFAKQLRAESLLLKRGVHVITDSPLLMQLIYAKKLNCPFLDQLTNICLQFETLHKSINFVIKREVPYVDTGRYQTEQEAKEIDDAIIATLDQHKELYLPYYPMRQTVKDMLPWKIFNEMKNEVRSNILSA